MLDGTVLPSGFSYNTNYSLPNFHNPALRVGEVQEIIFPDSPLSLSKQFIEYRVWVQHKDLETQMLASRQYYNCWAANLFGGVADKLTFTYRPDTKQSSTYDVGLGSKVLILCINADQNQAVIIGGVRDYHDPKDKDLGHNLHFVFNGLDIVIDKNGQLFVQSNGPTQNDGNPLDSVDTKVNQTKISLLPNGVFQVSTQNGTETLTIDKSNGKISLKANSAIELAVSNGKTSIKSNGLDVGNATDAMLLGSTYRQAQSQLHAQLITGLTSLSAALAATAPGAVAPISNMLAAISQFEAGQYLSKKNNLD